VNWAAPKSLAAAEVEAAVTRFASDHFSLLDNQRKLGAGPVFGP